MLRAWRAAGCSELSERAGLILQKYEKYDAEMKKKGNNVGSTDAFTEELQELQDEVDKLNAIAAEVALESNRAAVASKNAEIRRVKNVMLTDAIESISKKVEKGKGVNKQIIEDRAMQVSELIDRIYAIPDGMSGGDKRPSRYNSLGKQGNQPMALLDVDGKLGQHLDENLLYWQGDGQTQEFEETWKTRKAKQDVQLGRIEKTVEALGELANGVGEVLDRQDPVLRDVESQINKVTATIRTNNVKLKGLVHKLANTRNFCVDVVLIIILLAIGGYLYNVLKNV